MKRQLTSILLFSALLMGGASTFVSCTDHESDAAYNTSISIADVVAKQVEALKQADQAMLNRITALEGETAQLRTDVNANKARIEANESAIARLKEQVEDNTNRIMALEQAQASNLEKFQALDQQLAETNGTLNALGERVDGLETTLNGIVAQLPAELARLNNAIEDIAALKTMTDETNNRVAELDGKINDLTADLAEAINRHNEDVATLNEAIKAINDELEPMKEQLDEVCRDVENLKDAIEDILNKGVSGIEIQATDSPVTGYENAAFLGAQVNILSAYWGQPSTGDADFEVEGGKVIASNAGNIYVNVNPANVDPEGITFKLVDSQGNEAPGFELGAPVASDKVLTFGVSRAASANGFYAIPVKCVNPAAAGLDLNKGELKEAAKNVLAKLQNPKSTNLNLSGIASALYNNTNNKLKAYGLQASWTQKDAEGNEVKKVVTSKLNMAAFAVKPLGYSFLANNSKLESINLDRFLITSKLSDKLAGINAIDFSNIIDPSTGKTMEIATIVAVPGVRLYEVGDNVEIRQTSDNSLINTINNAKVKEKGKAEQKIEISVEDKTGSQTLTTYIYEVKFQDNTVKNLIEDINNSISGKLEPVQKVIDQVNNAAAKFDAAISTVNNLIKKINGRISDVNRLLQPAMLYQSSNGAWNFLSTGNHFATRFVGVGATPLVATSYTAELLAPAYKKQLYVKEAGAEILVNGKATKAAFDGEIQKVVFNASKAGNYTIVYKAIDYTGNVVEKNFYVTVK